jgi:hypothetical protein
MNEDEEDLLEILDPVEEDLLAIDIEGEEPELVIETYVNQRPKREKLDLKAEQALVIAAQSGDPKAKTKL